MGEGLASILKDARTELLEVLIDNDWCNADDEVHQIADSNCPIYTGDILELAANNIELATAEPDIGPAFDGKPTPVNIIAANIYETICADLREFLQELEERRDDLLHDPDEIWDRFNGEDGYFSAEDILDEGQRADLRMAIEHRETWGTPEGSLEDVPLTTDEIVDLLVEKAEELAEDDEDDEDDGAPCLREHDGEGWQCVNDFTACIFNNGHNTCTAPDADGVSPLGD